MTVIQLTVIHQIQQQSQSIPYFLWIVIHFFVKSAWCVGCSGVDNRAHAVGPGLEGTPGGSVRLI